MVTNFAITGNTEILQVAEAVAREKGLPKDSVIEALEQAIQTVGRKKYGHNMDIDAEINKKTGEISLFRKRLVTEDVEDIEREISLKEALKDYPGVTVGEYITDPLPPIEFGRVTSQTAKQIITQKIRDAEREKQFDDFKDRVGEIVNGVIKRIEYGNLIVDFGKTETLLRREDIIPREIFRPNDRIRAYIVDVRRETKGPQIFLSRTHNGFLAELFKQEVPEIYDGVISIQSVARDPGSHAKIAVSTTDSSVDPRGSCIGPRGVRVQAVRNELQGEKIDIIQFSSDLPTFVVNALAPKDELDISKIVIDEENNRIEVVVPEEQLSSAIGRRGQNVRLASQLIGWNIDVFSEEQESKRRTEEFKQLSELFVSTLNVEEIIAQLLATEGYQSVEEIAEAPIEELANIEGFDEEVAEELQNRAKEYLDEEEEKFAAQVKELGIEESIGELPGMSLEVMVALGEQGIKTRDDIANLSRDEFRELLPELESEDEDIDELIMAARAHWFENEEGNDEAAQA